MPQLYLHRAQGVVTSRSRQLCAFEKCLLQPGETRHVTLSIPPESLTQYDMSMRVCTPPGRIEWYLADSGETKLNGEFILQR